jgi:hypothetical protein
MIPLALLSLVLCVLSLRVLVKHRRRVAHHRASLPVIGSSPKLTAALHDRLLARQPQSDWLNPATMRAKCAAWLRRENIQN